MPTGGFRGISNRPRRIKSRLWLSYQNSAPCEISQTNAQWWQAPGKKPQVLARENCPCNACKCRNETRFHVSDFRIEFPTNTWSFSTYAWNGFIAFAIRGNNGNWKYPFPNLFPSGLWSSPRIDSLVRFLRFTHGIYHIDDYSRRETQIKAIYWKNLHFTDDVPGNTFVLILNESRNE
jgi:hypothetical protein